MKFEERFYTQYDPFEGDRDTDIKCRRVSVVKVRKDHNCMMGACSPATPHKIPKGSKARYETAIVDGEWKSYYVCLDCIEKWLIEFEIVSPWVGISLSPLTTKAG